MKKLLLFIAMLVPAIAVAATTIVSDPLDPIATHCGIYMDAAARVASPVGRDVNNKPICSYVLPGTVTAGTHTVKATAMADANGALESVQSLPLSFVVPLPAPANLRVIP